MDPSRDLSRLASILLSGYVRQLDAQETRLDVLRADIARLTRAREAAQDDLNRFIETLGGGPPR